MKKISMLLGTACAFAAILSSCSKMDVEEQVEPEVTGGEITLTINAGSSESKTFVDGTSIKWNSTGEYLRVFEDADGTLVNKKSAQGTTTDEGATMSFNVTLDTKSAAAFNYYAFYPNASYQSGDAVTNVGINTPYSQTPTATSFDPAADLLIAEPVDNGSVQATTLDMAFARVLAIGKMTVKNLGTTDPVKSITFSAKDGETAIPLAGRTSFNISTAKPVGNYGDRVANNMIVLDYSALSLTANGSTGMDAWFTCFPFDLGSGDSFKVVVETETQTFTKEVNLTTQNLSFKAGLASRFSVNMDGIAGESKAVDLKYANLTVAEVRAAGITSSTYGALDLTKPAHNDTWKGFVNSGSATGFGIRRNDSGNNDSYLQLPTFVNNLDRVVVTLSAAMTADKHLTLETAKDETTGTIASLTTVADQLVYEFDLTGLAERVKTGFLRANGVAANIAKVEMFAGTRDALSAPASVTASLNSDDPAVTNKIDVSWKAVSGAASYEVTLTPTAGDPVVATTASTSCSFSGLAYSTEYTPSVVAIADPYLNLNSASQAGSSASTGAASITNISAIKGLYTSADVPFSASLTDALVTVVSGNNFYLQDASGAVLGFKNSHGLTAGEKITGAITGTITKYNGNYRITGIDYSAATVTPGNTVTPTEVNAATLGANFADYESKYVKVNGVTISSVDGKNLSIDGDPGFIIYNTNSLAIPAESQFNAVGIVCFYNATKELTIYSLAAEDMISMVPTITASDQAVSVGKTVTIGATANSGGAISYTSNNTSVATVDASGVITGVAAGSTTITVSVAANGKYIAGSKTIAVEVSATSAVYSLYSGALTAGKYVIYYNGKAIKNTITSNRLDYVEVTPSDNKITNPNASIVWVVAADGDYWTLYNEAVSKYAASTTSNNQAKLEASVTDNSRWTVSGTSTYEFVNKARGDAGSNNKYLRNNGTYGFACYSSGTGGQLTLYKLNN